MKKGDRKDPYSEQNPEQKSRICAVVGGGNDAVQGSLTGPALGLALAAQLSTENCEALPVALVEGRPTDDAERFEILPFPMEDELGAPSFDGGTP